MLSAIKAFVASYAESKSKSKKKSGQKEKRPPAHKRNKHLRKPPTFWGRTRIYIKSRFRPKVLASSFATLLIIIAIACEIGYLFSPLEPELLSDFEVLRPNWTSEPYENNYILQHAKRLHRFRRLWPTSVVTDKENNAYISTETGAIVRIKPNDKGEVAEGKLDIMFQGSVANATLPFNLTGDIPGHPVALGLTEGTGLLFALDSLYGLYAVSLITQKSTSLLSITSNKTGLFTPTDFTIAEKQPDMYITDFSSKWSKYYAMNQMLEGSCTGRLLKFDFAAYNLTVIQTGLCGPVGVEIVANDSLVLVAEMGRPRIRVIQINTTEPITTKYIPLPGIPGKIKRNPRSGCWMPMTEINAGFFDLVNPRPWLRRLLAGILPQYYLKSLATRRHTMLAEIDPHGEVVDSMHDNGEVKLHDVQGVHEGSRGQLFFASEMNEHLAKLAGGEAMEEGDMDDPAEELKRRAAEEMRVQEKDTVFDPESENEDVASIFLGEKQRSKEEMEQMQQEDMDESLRKVDEEWQNTHKDEEGSIPKGNEEL